MPKESSSTSSLERLRRENPDKFVAEEKIFANIRPGDRIFIGSACAEPQHLVQALTGYVRGNPKAIFDTEILQVWTLGVAPYTEKPFQPVMRNNSFFVGNNTRSAVNQGQADYTPVFLSQVPSLFRRRLVPVDVALIQVSLPDEHGYFSLGVSVDIVKAAVEQASLVIAQVNPRMPRVYGDGFVHMSRIDFAVVREEPLLEFAPSVPDEIARKIGRYVARIVEDGDTIQVGYGSIPNAVLSALAGKKHLGVHTELLTDGIVELMRKGVVDNSRKSLDRDKAVTSFCMGRLPTYEFIDGNPAIEFKGIDYTNDPLVIARHDNMTAINTALEIDLTGQATAESIGMVFYSGIGGQADFMRGAILARGGKSILALQSTAEKGEVSRIVPFVKQGAGITLNRGDVHYVVTEYGIAHLHGKNIRERAMDLIAIAHPRFRPWLIWQAKELNLIYRDQAFIPGKAGEYPEHLETRKTARSGLAVRLRPVRITDEPLLKAFFYSLSDQSMYTRFMSARKDMPHERLQEYTVIDYTKEMVILAVVEQGARPAADQGQGQSGRGGSGRERPEGRDGEPLHELVVGMAEYYLDEENLTANVAFTVRDEYQNQGIGSELLTYIVHLARREGLHALTAEVLVDNKPMMRVFQKLKLPMEVTTGERVHELRIALK
jgi:acyl-CoA hydrolase/GNAT superfamily N-acetyltransferase